MGNGQCKGGRGEAARAFAGSDQVAREGRSTREQWNKVVQQVSKEPCAHLAEGHFQQQVPRVRTRATSRVNVGREEAAGSGQGHLTSRTRRRTDGIVITVRSPRPKWPWECSGFAGNHLSLALPTFATIFSRDSKASSLSQAPLFSLGCENINESYLNLLHTPSVPHPYYHPHLTDKETGFLSQITH